MLLFSPCKRCPCPCSDAVLRSCGEALAGIILHRPPSLWFAWVRFGCAGPLGAGAARGFGAGGGEGGGIWGHTWCNAARPVVPWCGLSFPAPGLVAPCVVGCPPVLWFPPAPRPPCGSLCSGLPLLSPVPGWQRSLICCEGPKPNSRFDIEPRMSNCMVCSVFSCSVS